MVPQILANFKLMEDAGLTLEQIGRLVAATLDADKSAGKAVLAVSNSTNLKDDQAADPNLMVTFAKLLQNQAEMQQEIIRIFNAEVNTLRERIAHLEKLMSEV